MLKYTLLFFRCHLSVLEGAILCMSVECYRLTRTDDSVKRSHESDSAFLFCPYLIPGMLCLTFVKFRLFVLIATYFFKQKEK
jgi:hypothetical protein